MEIDNTKNGSEKSLGGSVSDDTLHVRATIVCPNGDYKKTFKNQFLRKDLELMVVSIKVFEWLTCAKCGELLKLDLEFNI